jgi:hypothetical protein
VSIAAAIRARLHPGSLVDARFAVASLVGAIGAGCFLAGSARQQDLALSRSG